jgi:hypothetical protein
MDQASPEGVATPDVSGANVAPPAPAQNTAEAPQSNAAESPPAKVDEPKQEPKGVAKRIDELTRNWREAQRQNERLLAMLERQGQPAPQEQPKTEQPKSLKDFNYNEQAYQDHLYAEARKHAEKAAKEAGERWKAEQVAAQRRAKFEALEAEFAKTVEDYDEVTDPGPDPERARWACSEAMAEVIEESEEGPALKYYLAQNPNEALKLYRMSPAAAGRAMAKLEDTLVAERKKAAQKPVSQAPPPAPRIDASGDAAGLRIDPTSPESDALSDLEWMRKREKQIQSRRK